MAEYLTHGPSPKRDREYLAPNASLRIDIVATGYTIAGLVKGIKGYFSNAG